MKKLLKVLKPIIFGYGILYFITIGLMILYYLTIGPDEIKMDENMISVMIVGITISIIPISTFIYKKYHIKEEKINIKRLLYMIPLGFGVSWFYNMLTINFNQNNELLDLHILIVIAYVVILGPIFEELLFRYLALNKAKKVYSEKIALIIISISFGLMHSGLIGIIYAILIGYLLGYIYIKEKNILYPIIIHISANLASIFVSDFNIIFLIISIFLLLISYFLLFKRNKV